MKDNPYSVLMLSDSATEQEIEEAYLRLKKQYSNDRFLEGEDGNIAAKKLTELEQAYQDIQEDLKKKHIEQDYGSVYGEIEQLIKDGKLEDAQNRLDFIYERSAEWHYLQSILFYRKNWQLESKKQLEIAVNLDPENVKYREALTKLENVIKAGKGAPQNKAQGVPQGGNEMQNTSYDEQMRAQQNANQMGNCCCSLLAADCCCECMGGDLISCC